MTRPSSETTATTELSLPTTERDQVKFVRGLFMQGHLRADINEELLRHMTTARIKRILEIVQTQFAQISEEPRAAVLGWCMEATRDQYRNFAQIGDYVGALRCIALIEHLSKKSEDLIEKSQPDANETDFSW